MLPVSAALRRALATVITFAIAVSGAGVAVLAAPASPAVAAEGACPFYGDPPVNDTRWVNLDVTEPGWQVEFIDGVPSADSSANKKPPRHIETGGFAESLSVDSNWLSILGGTTSLEYRWYSDTIAPADPSTITLATPYTCSVKYPDPQAQTISGFSSIDGTSRRANQPVTFNATASSGLAVTYSSDTPAVCSLAGKVLSFARAGTCTVRASQAGNTDWLPAPDVTQTVTATLVPQTITGAPTYADARMGTEVPYPPEGETVTSSGRLAANLGIGYSLGGDCSFNDAWDAIRLDRVGTCQVIFVAYGDYYWAETTLTRTFQILPEQVTQTISIDALANMRVGDAAQTITSTTSSGLPATYSSRTTSVCTVSAGKVTPVAAGTCTVRASQAGGTVGNHAYSSATQDASFTVRGAYLAQTLTMSNLAGARLTVTPTVTVTSNTTLPYDVTSTTPSVCRVGTDKTTITLLDTGTCTIRATSDAGTVGADDYTAATPVEKSFAVLPEYRTQTVSATAVSDTRLDGVAPALAATASSGHPVTFTAATPTVCMVSNGQLSLLHAGTCRVSATQAGGVDPDDHKLQWAPQTATITFAVLPRLQSQAITFAQPAMLRTSEVQLVMPSSDSGRAVDLATTTSGICAVNAVTGTSWRITPIVPGTCTITATLGGATSGDVEYVAATPVTRSFDVWPAPTAQTITFPAPTGMRPSDAPQALAASASSALPVTYTVTTDAVCSVAGDSVTAIAAGTCTIVATQAGNVTPSVRDVYAAAVATQRSFQVRGNLVAQTITFPAPDDMRVGGHQPLVANATSGLAVTLVPTTLETCDVLGGAVVAISPGDCTLRASQPGGTRTVDDVEVDYTAATPVERTLTVLARLGAQTVSLAVPDSMRLGDAAATLEAEASSGLDVTLRSTTPAVCTVAAAAVAPVTPGTCEIEATQAGEVVGSGGAAVEYPTATTTKTFDVLPRLGTHTIDIAFAHPIRVGATATESGEITSGLDYQLTVETPQVCRLDQDGLTGLRTGTCTIVASSPGGVTGTGGDAVEYPAIEASKDFTVLPRLRDQQITFVQPDRIRVGDATASVLAPTSSSQLPVTLTSDTPRTCAVTDGRLVGLRTGECSVTASQRGGVVQPVDHADDDVVDDAVEYTAATPATRTVTVGPRLLDQSITSTALGRVRTGDAPHDLGVTASSGLPVDLTSTTPAICTVSSGKVVPGAVGTCVIGATQAGGLAGPDAAHDDTVEYRAAAPLTISFEVVTRQVAQTIRVRGERGVALSARTAPVTFTSSAGLPVEASSRTPRVCTVRGDDVRLISAGGCQLTATAAADDGHAAAEPVVVRFPVWGAPELPKRATTLRIVDVLGRGEDGYRVAAGPGDVCVAVRGRVVLSAAGRCAVEVRDDGRLVRSTTITVTETRGGQDAGPKGMDLAGSVRFASGSAVLSPAAKRTLRLLAPKLRTARLVVVYGNTAAYGGGDTAANRKLSHRRAFAVSRFLRSLHVKTRSMTVGMASRNPVSKDDNANRRADVYWLR